MTEARAPHKPPLAEVDFNLSPFIVFWEVTRACALACLHCRAKAQPRRHPLELTTEEGFALIDQIAAIDSPLLVITGGDPMMRPDLYRLIERAARAGLRVSLAPSATKKVTKEALRKVKEAGALRVSFSLDGPTAEVHDAFRQVPGSFQRTLECLRDAREVGLGLQVNSTISRYNLDCLDALAAKVAEFQPAMWSVFFLVPTGRGKKEDMISPQEHEEVFHWLYDFSRRVPFDVKTTAAEHYRRVVIQRQLQERGLPAGGPFQFQVISSGFDSGDGIGRAAKGVNDGKGCCFISHIGEVCPSGFLPLVAGSVREKPLAEIYRNSPLFRDLRDTSQLKGKCGYCPFNHVCGGSRARAYAVTGDYLAAEPYCIYQPPKRAVARGLDSLDRELLNLVQREVPLTSRPFQALGEKLGMQEENLLERLQRLKRDGILREISGIFDSRLLGYQSTLVAMRLPQGRLDEAGAIVSQHPGVSHNYARDHLYNLWFTLIIPAGEDLANTVEGMANRTGAEGYHTLPALKVFKLGVNFDMVGGKSASLGGTASRDGLEPRELSPLEKRIVRELQEELPLAPTPFTPMAKRLGLPEGEFLEAARDLQLAGVMRRYAAVLRHRQAGFLANALSCWPVPLERINELGKALAACPQVSHCYQRPTFPDWPYSILAMLHAKEKEECQAIASQLARETGLRDYLLLFSTKEYRKARVRYFGESR